MVKQTIQLSNGQSLVYYEFNTQNINKKPTLIFIHGNMSSSIWWLDTINILSKYNYHIVAVDLRGFGQSSYNNVCSVFGDWANDLVDFCSLKNIKKCIALGWSFGGGVSMKFAEIAPELVAKVVLTCSVSHKGVFVFNQQKPCKTRQEIGQNVKIKFMNDINFTKNLATLNQVAQSLLFTHSKDFPKEKRVQMIKTWFQQRCYVDLMFALANSDINIQNIKAKVLTIHGKEDKVIPLESVRQTGQHFKNFVVWENHAHMIPIQNIEKYALFVKEFIDQE